MKKYLTYVLCALLLGCASVTTINTLPQGAVVRQNGLIRGVTPYEFWDKEMSFFQQDFTLELEGYKPMTITLKKDVFYVHRLFTPPVISWLWLYGYEHSNFYELKKK
jgi:hypothetical protein